MPSGIVGPAKAGTQELPVLGNIVIVSDQKPVFLGPGFCRGDEV
jgi:hypothetical protein